MRRLLALLALPAMVFAVTRTPVPTPVDPNGLHPTLVKGATMDDGTWAVQDSSGRIWWSRDLGTHWDSIVQEHVDGEAELFGKYVLSNSTKRIWTFDSGWKNASIPQACLQGLARSTSIEGFSGAFERSTGQVTFCRTLDGFRSWQVWFAMDSSLAPATDKYTEFPIGSVDGGLVWYSVADSGYIRGTADGIRWFRSELPSEIKVVRFFLASPGQQLTIYGSKTGTDELFVAKSSDTGKTWSVKSETNPGALTAMIAPQLYWSTNYLEPNQRSNWLSRTADGPWIWIDSATSHGWLVVGSVPYVVEEAGIYRLNLDESGVSKRCLPGRLSITATTKSVSIELPESMRGLSWRLIAMDGRILESGTANATHLEITRTHKAATLQLGDRSIPLPPL